MQSLRRFRRLYALVALFWLPMSVFAQVCATQAMVSHIGGPQHPALVAHEEMRHVDHADATQSTALVGVAVVVDAATFWQSVDEFDAGCDMKSICAFAAMSALTSTDVAADFGGDEGAPASHDFAFSTRSLSPDTPPPRVNR